MKFIINKIIEASYIILANELQFFGCIMFYNCRSTVVCCDMICIFYPQDVYSVSIFSIRRPYNSAFALYIVENLFIVHTSLFKRAKTTALHRNKLLNSSINSIHKSTPALFSSKTKLKHIIPVNCT